MRAADLDARRDVYYSKRAGHVVHLTRECQGLQGVEEPVRKEARFVTAERSVCVYCDPETGSWPERTREVSRRRDRDAEKWRMLDEMDPEDLGL